MPVSWLTIAITQAACVSSMPSSTTCGAGWAAAGAAAAAEELSAANEDGSAPAGDNIDQTDTVQEENNDA